MDLLDNFTKGDFVWFVDSMKEIYRGRIVSINGDIFKLEICTDKKKSDENELDLVTCKKGQLRKLN